MVVHGCDIKYSYKINIKMKFKLAALLLLIPTISSEPDRRNPDSEDDEMLDVRGDIGSPEYLAEEYTDLPIHNDFTDEPQDIFLQKFDSTKGEESGLSQLEQASTTFAPSGVEDDEVVALLAHTEPLDADHHSDPVHNVLLAGSEEVTNHQTNWLTETEVAGSGHDSSEDSAGENLSSENPDPVHNVLEAGSFEGSGAEDGSGHGLELPAGNEDLMEGVELKLQCPDISSCLIEVTDSNSAASEFKLTIKKNSGQAPEAEEGSGAVSDDMPEDDGVEVLLDQIVSGQQVQVPGVSPDQRGFGIFQICAQKTSSPEESYCQEFSTYNLMTIDDFEMDLKYDSILLKMDKIKDDNIQVLVNINGDVLELEVVDGTVTLGNLLPSTEYTVGLAVHQPPDEVVDWTEVKFETISTKTLEPPSEIKADIVDNTVAISWEYPDDFKELENPNRGLVVYITPVFRDAKRRKRSAFGDTEVWIKFPASLHKINLMDSLEAIPEEDRQRLEAVEVVGRFFYDNVTSSPSSPPAQISLEGLSGASPDFLSPVMVLDDMASVVDASDQDASPEEGRSNHQNPDDTDADYEDGTNMPFYRPQISELDYLLQEENQFDAGSSTDAGNDYHEDAEEVITELPVDHSVTNPDPEEPEVVEGPPSEAEAEELDSDHGGVTEPGSEMDEDATAEDSDSPAGEDGVLESPADLEDVLESSENPLLGIEEELLNDTEHSPLLSVHLLKDEVESTERPVMLGVDAVMLDSKSPENPNAKQKWGVKEIALVIGLTSLLVVYIIFTVYCLKVARRKGTYTLRDPEHAFSQRKFSEYNTLLSSLAQESNKEKTPDHLDCQSQWTSEISLMRRVSLNHPSTLTLDKLDDEDNSVLFSGMDEDGSFIGDYCEQQNQNYPSNQLLDAQELLMKNYVQK